LQNPIFLHTAARSGTKAAKFKFFFLKCDPLEHVIRLVRTMHTKNINTLSATILIE
jgi:hypothetical protein